MFGADVIHDANQKLCNEHKESKHYKLCHSHLGWIQRLCRPRKDSTEPVLPTKFPKTKSVTVAGLKCTSCCCGKATKQSDDTIS